MCENMFIGRKSELAKLEKMFSTSSQEAVLIYGRRRIGKSELIKQFIKSHPTDAIYYECRETTELNNVEALARLISEKFALPPLNFSDIESILDFFFKAAKSRKFILVLDEYPYLRQTVTGLDSILQSLLDKYADESQLKLILCGSFIGTMKALMLHHNPLYGRFSLALNIKPMDYQEAAQFYPTFSNEDKVRLYSVFGGIPYYNRLISKQLSVKENIIELIASPGARLENEVSMYLNSELSKIINANEVFEQLAVGVSKFSDLLNKSHISSSPALSESLKKLMQMDMVAKEAPINDKNNKKRAGYYIQDNLARFYYRYVFRYSSQLRIMNSDLFYDTYIARDFEEQYVPKRFEDICRQFLIKKNIQGEMDIPFEDIGKFYYDLPAEKRNGEFDVVTKDAKGYVFYEVKFTEKPISTDVIEAEIKQVNDTGLYCYKYGFFARAGYDNITRDDVIAYQLSDLY